MTHEVLTTGDDALVDKRFTHQEGDGGSKLPTRSASEPLKVRSHVPRVAEGKREDCHAVHGRSRGENVINTADGGQPSMPEDAIDGS